MTDRHALFLALPFCAARAEPASSFVSSGMLRPVSLVCAEPSGEWVPSAQIEACAEDEASRSLVDSEIDQDLESVAVLSMDGLHVS